MARWRDTLSFLSEAVGADIRKGEGEESMKISQSGLLGRIYRWYYEKLSDRHVVPDETNLCQFCRTIFVWLPIKVLSLVGIVLFCVFCVLFLFFILIPENIGWAAHWIVWGAITSGFVWWYLTDNDLMSEVHIELPEPVRVFGAWIAAKKQKICPFIEWTE